jgi:hypothetical protein
MVLALQRDISMKHARAYVAAAVATACLLSSGCTAIVKRPSGASLLADLSFGLSAYVVVKDQMCRPGEFCIEDKGMATVIFGLPLALVGALAGAWAIGNDSPIEDATPAERDDELPERPTDPVTLKLALQARAAVRAGQCEGARATLELIAARDAEYHIAMLASGVLGACP